MRVCDPHFLWCTHTHMHLRTACILYFEVCMKVNSSHTHLHQEACMCIRTHACTYTAILSHKKSKKIFTPHGLDTMYPYMYVCMYVCMHVCMYAKNRCAHVECDAGQMNILLKYELVIRLTSSVTSTRLLQNKKWLVINSLKKTRLPCAQTSVLICIYARDLWTHACSTIQQIPYNTSITKTRAYNHLGCTIHRIGQNVFFHACMHLYGHVHRNIYLVLFSEMTYSSRPLLTLPTTQPSPAVFTQICVCIRLLFYVYVYRWISACVCTHPSLAVFTQSVWSLLAACRYVCMYTQIKRYKKHPLWQCMHACMHTYVHTYMHAFIHMYMNACIHSYIYWYMHAYIHTYIDTHIHKWMHAYIHSYIHARMHAFIHTFMHTWMHAYIHSYIHSYTHTYMNACTHTYKPRSQRLRVLFFAQVRLSHLLRLCMYVCMYVCMYQMSVCVICSVHACMYLFVCTWMYICLCVCVCTHACVYVHACAHIYIYIYMYIYICIICTYVFMYVCVWILMHTFIHAPCSCCIDGADICALLTWWRDAAFPDVPSVPPAYIFVYMSSLFTQILSLRKKLVSLSTQFVSFCSKNGS